MFRNHSNLFRNTVYICNKFLLSEYNSFCNTKYHCLDDLGLACSPRYPTFAGPNSAEVVKYLKKFKPEKTASEQNLSLRVYMLVIP